MEKEQKKELEAVKEEKQIKPIILVVSYLYLY